MSRKSRSRGDGEEKEEDKKRRDWKGEKKIAPHLRPAFKPATQPSFQLGHDTRAWKIRPPDWAAARQRHAGAKKRHSRFDNQLPSCYPLVNNRQHAPLPI